MTETCESCKHSELCEDGCAFFEGRIQGPFAPSRHYGLAPASRLPGIVARFPGHAPHRMTDLCEEGVKWMCDWLNERWAERGDE